MNLEELAAQGKELGKTTSPEGAETTQQIVQSEQQPEAPQKPVIPQDDNYTIQPNDKGGLDVQVTETGEYQGPGIVISNDQNKPEGLPAYTGVTPETQEHVSNYMKNLEADIERERQISEEIKKKQEEEKDPEQAEKENAEAFTEAVVVIDKLGMGQVINFTDAEREKMERARKIRVEEVETVELNTLKRKRSKKGSLPTVLKRQVSALTTPIILPASGYTAIMKGCSPYEIMSLMGAAQNALIDTTTKWTTIFNKIVSTSIGEMDFDTFLKETASSDYNSFIYGLLCSTYPDDDKIPLKCPKCGKEHEHHYSVRSLIRAEKMTDKMKARVAEIVDGSHTAEDARRIHANAPIGATKTIRLPLSGIVMELYVQTAFDLIYTSIKGLEENKDPKLNDAAILSTAVKTVLIEDPENKDEYLEFDSVLEIAETIYNLQDTDLKILTQQTDTILNDINFQFGLMNVKCPNEKCKNFEESIEFDIETILFYRYQQAMNTKAE